MFLMHVGSPNSLRKSRSCPKYLFLYPAHFGHCSSTCCTFSVPPHSHFELFVARSGEGSSGVLFSLSVLEVVSLIRSWSFLDIYLDFFCGVPGLVCGRSFRVCLCPMLFPIETLSASVLLA